MGDGEGMGGEMGETGKTQPIHHDIPKSLPPVCTQQMPLELMAKSLAKHRFNSLAASAARPCLRFWRHGGGGNATQGKRLANLKNHLAQLAALASGGDCGRNGLSSLS